MLESVYLASKSPRRLELLKQIGIHPIVIAAEVAEIIQPEESTLEYAERIALDKAQAGFARLEKQTRMPVIGADTIVVCENKIIGKPRDKQEGMAILNLLSGRSHQVITAVAITNAMKTRQCVVESEVTFAPLTAEEIEHYWNTGEPHDKAGAYAIQGKAAAFITYLKGSYSSVVGLPLFETTMLLRDFGVRV